jgi:hypothetical protein
MGTVQRFQMTTFLRDVVACANYLRARISDATHSIAANHNGISFGSNFVGVLYNHAFHERKRRTKLAPKLKQGFRRTCFGGHVKSTPFSLNRIGEFPEDEGGDHSGSAHGSRWTRRRAVDPVMLGKRGVDCPLQPQLLLNLSNDTHVKSDLSAFFVWQTLLRSVNTMVQVTSDDLLPTKPSNDDLASTRRRSVKRKFGNRNPEQSPKMVSESRAEPKPNMHAIIEREQERQVITQFLQRYCSPSDASSPVSRKGGSLYISGCPGTGKTALVTEILSTWRKDCTQVLVNCMTLSSPSAIFARLIAELQETPGGRSHRYALDTLKEVLGQLEKPWYLFPKTGFSLVPMVNESI